MASRRTCHWLNQKMMMIFTYQKEEFLTLYPRKDLKELNETEEVVLT